MVEKLIVPKYDVAIALGGGLKHLEGVMDLHGASRLDKLVDLYREGASKTFLMSAGDSGKSGVVQESRVMKNYLVNMGIPDEQILLERKSMDTIENAYYSRVGYTDPGNYRHPLVVTSEFHMPRSQGIFEWVLGPDYNSEFEPASDKGIDPEKLRKRQGIEAMINEFNERVLYPNIKKGDLVRLGAFMFNPEDKLRMEYKEFLDSFVRDASALY